jgi:hypothetical protein
MNEFNLTQYFLEGYTSCVFDKAEVDPLLVEVRKQNFIRAGLHKYADWDKSLGEIDKRGHFNEVPEFLRDAASEVAQSGYFQWFTKIYGQFTQRTVFLNQWEKGDSLDWFLRPSLGVFTHNILILSHELFSDEDGGQLTVGMCDSDENGNPVQGTEMDIASIVPSHGTMLTLYSMNPNVLFRISQLKTDKELYTIHFCFGYVENTLMRGTA